MNLLIDQSKVIGSLQKTIEVLNITIKNLNDKIERMKASNEIPNVDVDVTSINVTKSSKNETSISVTKSSKNDHPRTVHENAVSPKCLGKSIGSIGSFERVEEVN